MAEDQKPDFYYKFDRENPEKTAEKMAELRRINDKDEKLKNDTSGKGEKFRKKSGYSDQEFDLIKQLIAHDDKDDETHPKVAELQKAYAAFINQYTENRPALYKLFGSSATATNFTQFFIQEIAFKMPTNAPLTKEEMGVLIGLHGNNVKPNEKDLQLVKPAFDLDVWQQSPIDYAAKRSYEVQAVAKIMQNLLRRFHGTNKNYDISFVRETLSLQKAFALADYGVTVSNEKIVAFNADKKNEIEKMKAGIKALASEIYEANGFVDSSLFTATPKNDAAVELMATLKSKAAEDVKADPDNQAPSFYERLKNTWNAITEKLSDAGKNLVQGMSAKNIWNKTPVIVKEAMGVALFSTLIIGAVKLSGGDSKEKLQSNKKNVASTEQVAVQQKTINEPATVNKPAATVQTTEVKPEVVKAVKVAVKKHASTAKQEPTVDTLSQTVHQSVIANAEIDTADTNVDFGAEWLASVKALDAKIDSLAKTDSVTAKNNTGTQAMPETATPVVQGPSEQINLPAATVTQSVKAQPVKAKKDTGNITQANAVSAQTKNSKVVESKIGSVMNMLANKKTMKKFIKAGLAVTQAKQDSIKLAMKVKQDSIDLARQLKVDSAKTVLKEKFKKLEGALDPKNPEYKNLNELNKLRYQREELKLNGGDNEKDDKLDKKIKEIEQGMRDRNPGGYSGHPLVTALNNDNGTQSPVALISTSEAALETMVASATEVTDMPELGKTKRLDFSSSFANRYKSPVRSTRRMI